jgi:hypothetical protein
MFVPCCFLKVLATRVPAFATARLCKGQVLSAFAGLFPEEVVDGLDWVKGGKGYFDEEGVPVCHGAVPETGKLLGLEGDGPFGLFANEAGVGVDIFAEVEIAAVVVLGGAY